MQYMILCSFSFLFLSVLMYVILMLSGGQEDNPNAVMLLPPPPPFPQVYQYILLMYSICTKSGIGK